MEQVIVRYCDFPCGLKGCVRIDADCNYNVYINTRLSYNEQDKALRHELAHITNGDMWSCASVGELEKIATVG